MKGRRYGGVAAMKGLLPPLKYQVSSALKTIPGGPRFCQLAKDSATERFLQKTSAAPFSLQLAHKVCRMVVGHYDACALLKIYPLHLLSSGQLGQLLESAQVKTEQLKVALDIGAGDGSMAQELLVPICDKVICTDTSRKMVEIARKRNGLDAHCLDICDAESKGSSELTAGSELIDVALLLNVLDRTGRPQTLLKRLKDLLRPKGICVIATPLPFRPVFYDGRKVRKPLESLSDDLKGRRKASKPVSDQDWELDAMHFLVDVLPRHGFKPLSFARAPYISAGDPSNPWVVYDDLVVCCEKSS